MSGLAALTARMYRRNLGRLWFYSALMSVGAASLFAVDNLLRTVDAAVAVRARELLAADAAVSANRPFDAQASAVFARRQERGARRTDVVSFATMLASEGADPPFLVSVKAVEAAYPFYGTLDIAPPEGRAKLDEGLFCLVDEAAALRRGLAAGDSVGLGLARFTVAGIVRSEPDRGLSAFNLAPRVFIGKAALESTGLIRFGSRIRHEVLFALPPSADPKRAAAEFKEALEEDLKDPYLNVNDFPSARGDIARALDRSSSYFVLVGLVALLLGTVGMAAGTSAFLEEQAETAGVLRCLGLSPKDIARLYHALCLAVGAQAGLLGSALGWALSAAGLAYAQKALGFEAGASAGFSWPALAQTTALCMLLSAVVTHARVLALSRLAPLAVLRDGAPAPASGKRSTLLSALAVFLALTAFAYAKSKSIELSAGFAVGLSGAVLAAAALSSAALRALGALAPMFDRSGGPLAFAARHGLRQLTRKRQRTRTFLFTLTLGFALLGALGAVHRSLSSEILLGRSELAPDLFLVDIQKSQLEGVRALAARFGAAAQEFSPLVRARLSHVNGEPVSGRRDDEGGSVESRRRGRFLTREYNLTYKAGLNASERLLEGSFWKGDADGQISLEEGFSRRVGVGLGDVLRFDIQGRAVEARVSSIRAIDWISMKPNFFVVFPPSMLERAPQTFIGSLRVADPERSAQFQRELYAAFPNVSAIDLKSVLDRVQSVLGTLLTALTAIAWFSVAVGLMVLAGTLSLARRQRAETAALFRSLGAERRTLAAVDAVELAALGASAAAASLALSTGLGAFIASRMGLEFYADPRAAALLAAAALLLPPAAGLAAQWTAYRTPVLEALRRGEAP